MGGQLEAQWAALSGSNPPAGYAQWTLRLLSHKLVELGCVDSICHETVNQVLKKEIKPCRRLEWAIASAYNAHFVVVMEQVLDIEHRPYTSPSGPEYG